MEGLGRDRARRQQLLPPARAGSLGHAELHDRHRGVGGRPRRARLVRAGRVAAEVRTGILALKSGIVVRNALLLRDK